MIVLLLMSLMDVRLPALQAPATRQQSFVLTHVTVIDATGAPPQSDMAVVVNGNRIVAVAKTEKIKIPNDAQVVEASGKFLIPGLWDMHVHTLWRNWSETFFSLFIANGITGVRDMFGDLERLKKLRLESAGGKLLSPRIVASGLVVDGPKPIWPGSITAANAAEGRKAVLSLKQRGADFVKVYDLLPREAYFAIADEVKKQGMVFTGHVPIAVSAAEASAMGQKSIEHLNGILLACSSHEQKIRDEIVKARSRSWWTSVITQADIRTRLKKALDTYSEQKAKALFDCFVQNNTWQCPTLTNWRGVAFIDDGNLTNDARRKYVLSSLKADWHPKKYNRTKDWTPEDFALAKRDFQKALEIVGAMRRAGVKFLAGTDTPTAYCFPGFSLHDELGLLVKAGLTPIEALQAATINPANSLGAIAKGKIADLVLLEANPLQDIRNTQKIAAVVCNGQLFQKTELQKMLNEVEVAAKKLYPKTTRRKYERNKKFSAGCFFDLHTSGFRSRRIFSFHERFYAGRICETTKCRVRRHRRERVRHCAGRAEPGGLYALSAIQ